MKIASSIIIFLTLVSSMLTLDLSRFWSVNQTPTVMEPARPIEIVRWRQPVCLMPAKGVTPCYLALRKLENEYESASVKGIYQETSDHPLQQTNLRLAVPSRDEEEDASKSLKIATDAPLLQSSEISAEAPVDRSLKTPELTRTLEETIEERRYLGIREETTVKPQQIYFTKVLNAPVTATLVAHNCLPDIGIPLCDDYQAIQPSEPVFDPKPAVQPTETGKPSNKPGNCQNPVNHVLDGNQNSGSSVNLGFNEPVVRPIPTRRPVELAKPSFDQAVCHSCIQSTPAKEKLEHIVISLKPGAGVVEERPHTIPSGSPFHYFDSTQRFKPDQQIKTEFDIHLSRNSESEIEGQGTEEEPSKVKTSKNKIFQTIHDIMNKTEKLAIVQRVQSFFQRPNISHQESEGSTSVLSNLFRPLNLFNRRKGANTARPETSIQDSSTVSATVAEASKKTPGMEVAEKPAIMDILHKPEDNISNSPGLLDIFESARDNPDAESLVKPTEKPGLPGDLFANPVRPIEAENGKVDSGRREKLTG